MSNVPGTLLYLLLDVNTFIGCTYRSDREENTSKATVITFDRDGVEMEHVIERSEVSAVFLRLFKHCF